MYHLFPLFFVLRRSTPVVLPTERMPWLLITDNISDDDDDDKNSREDRDEENSGGQQESEDDIFDEADDEWMLRATYDIL